MKRLIADSVASFVAQPLLLCTFAGLPASAIAQGPFTLSSAEVKQNAAIGDTQVFKGLGCSGGNVSPSLSWRMHRRRRRVLPQIGKAAITAKYGHK